MFGQGEILKKLIKESGDTQQEFAVKLGISRNYLLTLLDKKIIHEDYLNKVCKILNVNYNVFTIEENKEEKININEPKKEKEPKKDFDMVNKLMEIIIREQENSAKVAQAVLNMSEKMGYSENQIQSKARSESRTGNG